MANQKPDTLPTGTDVLAVLSQLRRGQTAADLADGLRDLVAAVRATGKKGSLTLKLTVAPHSNGDDVTLTLADDVTLKVPRAERGSSIFFATEQNGLVRNDPRQGELRFEVVTGGKPETGDRKAEAGIRKAN